MAQISESSPRFQRKPALIALTLVCVLLLASYGVYAYVLARDSESTEDAYVAGNLVQVMPQVAGTVLSIHADETDFVKAGQVLVELDAADKRIALEQAEAELAQAVRDVRVMFATRDQLMAQLAVRQAELDRARADVERRKGLSARGLVPREELEHAQDELKAAEAAVRAAAEALAAMNARIDGTTVADHPSVARASAKLKDAYLALQRTTLRAPISGHVAKRVVQVGQHVEPGAALMAIVPLEELWVDANFKEIQLRRMRIGQKARVTADIYGRSVTYEGEVAGLGVGTGAAFALLPPQNASGNWIKVVQRVPVRIRLNPDQLQEHPLRIGLSMHVRVDLRKDGPQLASVPRATPAYTTRALAEDVVAAEERIRQIVNTNFGAKILERRT
ncbi:MAG TPA: efflux RND transporter periplasmic adaptor subunit, partial [Steroidobacteraceae bacterium]